MTNPITDADWDFAVTCGSFGGVKTSDDGHIIPIAKTEPFTPEMIPHDNIPSGGGRYRLKVWEGGQAVLMVQVVTGWARHNPTGQFWLGMYACNGDDYREIAQNLHAFAGKAVTITFKLI